MWSPSSSAFYRTYEGNNTRHQHQKWTSSFEDVTLITPAVTLCSLCLCLLQKHIGDMSPCVWWIAVQHACNPVKERWHPHVNIRGPAVSTSSARKGDHTRYGSITHQRSTRITLKEDRRQITQLNAYMHPQYLHPQPLNSLDLTPTLPLTWWILPSKSLASYYLRLHTPSSGRWEHFAIYCGRFAVTGWWHWPPGAWLERCCCPPRPPSLLSGNYWMMVAW